MKNNRGPGTFHVLIPLFIIGAATFCAYFIRLPLYRLIYGVAAAAAVIGGGTVYFILLLRKRPAAGGETVDIQATAADEPAIETTAMASEINDERTIEEIDSFFNALAKDIAGKSEIIPVLIQQLNSVIEMTDEAAMTLSTNFMGINKKAKAQVEEVCGIFGDLADSSGGGADAGSLLAHLKEVLQTLVSEMRTITTFVKKNQQSINQILTDVGSIKEIVSKINSITEDSKVLSINAAIEAARAGESGKGFAVVASEFRKLSEDSDQAHREIQEIVEHVTGNTRAMLEYAEDSVKKGDQVTARAEDILQGTVGEIDKTIGKTREKLEELSSHAQDLAKNISKIVVSIQFQDITRQRIEHVIEPLDDFVGELDSIAERLRNADTEDFVIKKSHAERLKERYTMEQEKLILQATVDNKEE